MPEDRELQAAADQFRVLVVDDEIEPFQTVSNQLQDIADVAPPIHARTQAEALELLREQVFDAVFLDIQLDKEGAVHEVFRQMAEFAPDAWTIMVTKLPDEVLPLIGRTRPAISGFAKKGAFKSATWAASGLKTPLDHWRDRRLRMQGLDLVVNALMKRRRDTTTRDDPYQVATEVDRLLRGLFGAATSLAGERWLEITPIERQGFSKAITVRGTLYVGHDEHGLPVEGGATVIKVGPRRDIEVEAFRYESFVRYGVRLRHRIEMLGSELGQTLGAISYSFAGGVHGEALTSLDDLLTEDQDETLVDGALDELFKQGSKNWYGVTTEEVTPLTFLQDPDGHKLDIGRSFERLDAALSKLVNRFAGQVRWNAPSRVSGKLDISGIQLEVPSPTIFGQGPFVAERPACLVHGDMHGGNVMVELESGAGEDMALRRVCLIDFRSAGRGPRLLDFVALEASVRLADAGRIAQSSALQRQLSVSAMRVNDERVLLQERFGQGGDDRPDSCNERWCRLVRELHSHAENNFAKVTQDEYLVLGILYGVRQMGLSLDPVARVRLLAWISALNEALFARESG